MWQGCEFEFARVRRTGEFEKIGAPHGRVQENWCAARESSRELMRRTGQFEKKLDPGETDVGHRERASSTLVDPATGARRAYKFCVRSSEPPVAARFNRLQRWFFGRRRARLGEKAKV